MRKEILLSKLDEYVVNRDALSDRQISDKWQVVPYETDSVSGNMLLAGECAQPPEIELKLGVKGFYRISLCMTDLCNGGASGAELSLSGERKRTYVRTSHLECVNGNWRWAGYEYAEEDDFIVADLTGKSLFINKPDNGRISSCAVLFIRLTPVESDELAELSRQTLPAIMYHYDEDYYNECDYAAPSEYAGRVELLRYGNGCALINETFYDDAEITDRNTEVSYIRFRSGIDRTAQKYLRNKTAIKKVVVDAAHSMGLIALAGNRMELGDFVLPYAEQSYNSGEVKRYPEFRCRTRDGRYIAALSYAYPEVRRIAVEKMLRFAEGFDGVSLFFHRGVHVAFEEPVKAAVREKYGVDASLLPFSDKRLSGVLCGFMTEFMRELKAALVEKAARENRPDYKITVVVFYDAESSEQFSLDVKTWVEEGLTDGVAQGLMKHYEDLEGCMSDDDPSLISLGKYVRKRASAPVLKRYYGDDAETVVKGFGSLKRAVEGSKAEVYAALAWEGRTPEYQTALAEKLYAAGAEKFICWNANHIATKLPTLKAIKLVGNKEKLLAEGKTAEFRKVYRILSVGGYDISDFNPNWRG